MKSTQVDEIDPIYQERDPIAKSLELRKIKGGLATFVVKDAPTKMGKFFFKLSVKSAAAP